MKRLIGFSNHQTVEQTLRDWQKMTTKLSNEPRILKTKVANTQNQQAVAWMLHSRILHVQTEDKNKGFLMDQPWIQQSTVEGFSVMCQILKKTITCNWAHIGHSKWCLDFFLPFPQLAHVWVWMIICTLWITNIHLHNLMLSSRPLSKSNMHFLNFYMCEIIPITM